MPSFSKVQRLGDAEAGAVSIVTVTAVGFEGVATAIRTATGTLEIIVWEVEATGLVKRPR
jgi:hypothetical protein